MRQAQGRQPPQGRILQVRRQRGRTVRRKLLPDPEARRHGTFHSISEQHLQRYCDEFAFRWNHRAALGIEDFGRAAAILKGIESKEADLSTA
jgi:hypothetical protein